MARTGKVAVSITADPTGLERGLRRAEGDVDKFAHRTTGHFSRAAKAAAGFAAGLGAVAAARDAVQTTEELGKSTLALNRNLGLSIKRASEWSAVAKARGIESKQLAQAFGTLSKNVEAQSDAFKALGVSQKTLEGGNFQDILSKTADGLERMGPGAERTALSMKLFGRGWQTVVPLLRSGSTEMNAQLSLAEKYGATFGDKGAKGIQEFIAQQREAKLATLGLKVAFGTQLAPILTKVIEKFTNFAKQMRDGTGAGGEFITTLKNIWGAVRPVVKFFTDHPKFIGIAIAAWATYKAVAIAATIKTRLAVLGVFKPGPINAAASAAGAASGGKFAGRFASVLRGFGWAIIGAFIADKILGAASSALSGSGVFDAFGDAQVAVESDPIVRRGRRQLKSQHGAIGAFQRKYGKTLAKKFPGGDLSTAEIQWRLRHGDPGLIPGSPGVPKDYKPGHPYHGHASHRSAPVAGAASVVARTAAMPMAHASGTNWRRVARAVAYRYGLDPDIFERQIQAESGFDPNVRSPAGAIGIAQIMPGTAKAWGVNPLDPRQSLDAAAKHMAGYVRQFGSYANALRAYNAGPGAVQASHGYAETNAYVSRVLHGRDPGHLNRPVRVRGRRQTRRGHVTGDISGLRILGALQQMSGDTGIPIHVQSGKRTLSEQAALVKQKGLYSASNPTGAAAPSPRAPHVRGVAADITPGREKLGSVAHKYGLSFPLPEEPWHIQAASERAYAYAENGSTTHSGASFASAAPRPPTQAELNQSHSTAVTNALDLIGLRRDAGLIGAGTADRQTIGTIGKALHGKFGTLSGRDRLSLMGTQRTTRKDLAQRLKAKATAKSHHPFNLFVKWYNLLQDGIDAGYMDAETGRQQQIYYANWALKGGFGKLAETDRTEVLKILKQLNESGPDPTSFAGTPFDDAALTMAQVNTPGDTSDDLAIQQGRLGIARAGYSSAVASGDREGIVKWGELLQSLTSSIDSLQASVDQNTEVLLELQKTQTQQFQQLYNVSQAQYRVMVRGLTDAFSGEIGGRVGLGFMTPATAGSGASY